MTHGRTDVAFHERTLPIFDRAGDRLGALTKGQWAVAGPRSYRLNATEDFEFFVPRNDGTTPIISQPTLPTTVGDSSASTAGATNLAFSRPTGTVAGDHVLVLLGCANPSATITPPSAAWTRAGRVRGGGQALDAWWWKVGNANPATYTFTSSVSQAMAGGVITYRNAARFAPFAVLGSSGTTVGAPSVYAPVRNEIQVSFAVADRNTTWTVPGGFASRFNQAVAGLSVRAAQRSLSVEGPVAAATWTAGSSGDNLCASLIVQAKASVEVLLTRDNLVYLDNAITRPWGGVIDNVEYVDGGAHVRCIGTLSLLSGLETPLILQNEGRAVDIARRLVQAANAKQAANGDLVVGFSKVPGSTSRPNLGEFSWEGDILDGLQSLANSTVSEFYMASGIDGVTGKFLTSLMWGGDSTALGKSWPAITLDHTATIVHDGTGGQVSPGTRVNFAGGQRVSYARLTGATTRMVDHLDYPSVQSVLREVTPETTIYLPSVPGAPTQRRRERLHEVSVNWGYSRDQQKAMARQVQERYLTYYKSFLYAYHDRWGAPWWGDGSAFDWNGPVGTHGSGKLAATTKQFRMSQMRTVNVLARLRRGELITAQSSHTPIDASIEDVRLKERLTLAGVVGVATDYARPGFRWAARASDGTIRHIYRGAFVAQTLVVKAAQTGETLRGISTDRAEAHNLWALVTSTGKATVRRYDMSTGALMSAWSVADATMRDIAVDLPHGVIYTAGAAGVTITARSLANGGVLVGDGGNPRQYPGLPTGTVAGLGLVSDFLYCVGTQGGIRFLHAKDGAFAGSKTLPFADITGAYIDDLNLEMWVTRPDVIECYHATLAMASPQASGYTEGAPGFESIATGTFGRIVAAWSRHDVGYNVPQRPTPSDEAGGKPPPDDGSGHIGYRDPPLNLDLYNAYPSVQGIPNGAQRRDPFVISQPILAIIHRSNIQNFSDGSYPPGVQTGQATRLEVEYLKDRGPIASYHVARNGAYLSVIPRATYASNAHEVTFRSPNTSLAAIVDVRDRRIVGGGPYGTVAPNATHHSSGYWTFLRQPGEFAFAQIMVTAADGYGVTDEQKETVAYLLAKMALARNVELKRGVNVLLHSDFDPVRYANCPFGSDRERKLAAIIARATEIKRLMGAEG
jgi:hypothetical protein